jgi:hypothetical protein
MMAAAAAAEQPILIHCGDVQTVHRQTGRRIRQMLLQLCGASSSPLPPPPSSLVADAGGDGGMVVVGSSNKSSASSWFSPSHVSDRGDGQPKPGSPRPPSRLPRKLRQHDDGSVLAEDLVELERLEFEAAARRDYRQATLLHCTLDALQPKPALTRQLCAPSTVDAQEDFFLQNGFVVINDVLRPDQLSRAQAAWVQAQPQAQADWEAQGRPDGFFDIPNLFELDDAFVDMVDSPALVPLMARVTGFQHALDPAQSISAGGATGCTRCSKMSGRVVPSGGTESYTWWHNDVSPAQHRTSFCLCQAASLDLFSWRLE